MVKIDVLTLFPDMFKGPFDASIIKRAQSKGLIEVCVHDLRIWGEGARRNVDDRPYGGGVGMILRVDILDAAISKLKTQNSKVILFDATGERYTQTKAQELSKQEHLILIAGHYEGVDHRVHEHLVDKEPGYLEYPQYTRPENYKGWKVPKVLLSGNHKEIEKWRKS
ncbi:MAG: tRNA (guanosine(37)-N1)-methyltransferase TrmD [Candidatus Woesebacteria bacterium]|nr:tRNA (guanosine(37)-N1)-methyltransferase TrmD [Candidatus Woesebacteria bacterium]